MGRIREGEPALADFELDDDLRDGTRAAWKRYVDLIAPFRPDLHRYCWRLTGELWDAEDLVQDTIVRGFGKLSTVHGRIDNPRGYLVRIASNLWIDAMRRRTTERAALAAAPPEPVPEPPADQRARAREAGAELLGRLSPQERAAVLMKDVFDMDLKRIAEVLSTSVGAVKAALHRGRGRLDAEPAPERPRPSVALVDRFVELLNGSDLPGLLELMLDTATVEELGSVYEVGRDQFGREGSFLWQSVHVHPELPPEKRPAKWRNERAMFDGEPIVVSFGPVGDGERLMGVTRLEERDGRIAKLRAYIFTPETVRAVGEKLGLPVLTGLYRFPF